MIILLPISWCRQRFLPGGICPDIAWRLRRLASRRYGTSTCSAWRHVRLNCLEALHVASRQFGTSTRSTWRRSRWICLEPIDVSCRICLEAIDGLTPPTWRHLRGLGALCLEAKHIRACHRFASPFRFASNLHGRRCLHSLGPPRLKVGLLSGYFVHTPFFFVYHVIRTPCKARACANASM